MLLGREQRYIESSALRRFLRGLLGLGGMGINAKWLIFRYILNASRPKAPSRILDFGSGNGAFTFAMQKKWPMARIWAIDGNAKDVENSVEIAKKLSIKNLSFTHILFENFEFLEKFDLIICLDSIYYSENGIDYLEKLTDSLSPGGQIIISMPTPDKFYRTSFVYYEKFVDIERLSSTFNVKNVELALERGGLSIEKTIHYPGFILSKIIEWQEKAPWLVRIFYPIFRIVLLLNTEKKMGESTHFMISAWRNKNFE